MPTRTVTVNLGPRSYDVAVGAGLLVELGPRLKHLTAARSVLIVRDDGLPEALIERTDASLRAAGLAAASCPIHASERDKSLAAAQRIVEAAASARLERSDAIIALGGGVIGDLAGFAASIYRRGIAVIQCPTTLLAMVDASVGGKTAVNLLIPGAGQNGHAEARLLKNMAGTFHQPRLVLADVAALTSLPSRHLRAGLAECIKHALLAADFGDPGFITEVERHAPAIARGQASPETLAAFIARNVAIKAAVVAGDELETGALSTTAGATADHAGREALNLGHTFGHALEAIEHLSPDANPAHAPLHHGEAVALGLIAAAATAESLTQVPPGSTDSIRRLIESAGLPTRVAGLPSDDTIIAAMIDDKKTNAGRLRLVLPWREIGRVRVATSPPLHHVVSGIRAIRHV